MDNSYQIGGIPTHHSLPSAHLSSMQQRMPDNQGDAHTLPPLNGAVPQYPSYSVGMSQHPATTTASYASTPQGHQPSSLPQLAPQAQRAPQQMSAYSQAGPYMNMSQSMMPPASTAMASGLPASSSAGLPAIHPRPQDGSTLLAQLQQQQMPNQMLVPGNPGDPEPTHVVGQQGRRGILPSAPGRAPGNVKSTVPQKDQDGKYPCPHCTKTYQHAKHLKRHLLRHTGDRPYMCKLCKDTFSRSDILKRHFQKCSVRRGVVGDMDHLEGSRAHLQKNRQSIDTTQNIHFLNPVNPSPVYDGSVNQMGQMPSMMPQQSYPDGMHPSSARNSRSNSVARPANSFLENRRSMSALEQISTSRGGYENYSAFSTPGALPSMMPNGTQSGTMSTNQSPVHTVQNGLQNGHAYGGYGAQEAAQNMLQQEGQHTHHHQQDRGGPMASSFQKADVESAQNGQQLHNDMGWNHNEYPSQLHPNATLDWTKVKVEPGGQLLNNDFSTNDDAFSGLYTDPSGFNTRQNFGAWDMNDPVENKIAQLISFCITYSNSGVQLHDHQNEARLRQLLTSENVRDFLEEFKNYQGHWPMLHMPTFNPCTASDALVLGMICIGAVYSDKLDVPQVRWLMELVKTAVYRASPLIAAVKNSTKPSADMNCHYEIEEVQALGLLICLFLWHGNQAQRAQAREEFHLIAAVGRYCGLLQHTGLSHTVKPSVLHQLDSAPQLPDTSWDWFSWIEQEKRSRALYIFYLLDMALTLYFNSPPHFDPAEIQLRLPSDDAAWEATSSEDCARMLGLYGPDAQSTQNTSGSLSARQPEFQAALRSLFDLSTPAKTRDTNAYSKFILIHALHSILWVIQRRSSQGSTLHTLTGRHNSVSGGSTPETATISIANSANSGAATPESFGLSFAYAQVGLRGIKAALEKWKRSWDMDNDIQYSPAASVSPTSQGSGGRERLPRVGFCRDGIYFYYLAVQFCQRTSKALANASAGNVGATPEWQLPADTRFAYVMDLLKRIKHWMASEQGKTGRDFDLGSIGTLDDQYGMEDLTLDMKLLFTRIVPTTVA
ncbi:hypothetical protein NA57DRAFT_76125 [Rhizodiscina lignyota]|uniref:C2H2-type domain-containing protein n=1 Tax=Rhizodiscina lignyota TaxID=1504668 RepID=A0A9P4M6H6_9PEZI|nr:hypothetical protein NA57DRAFT_76125 [Rhizodiscina lignyota]